MMLDNVAAARRPRWASLVSFLLVVTVGLAGCTGGGAPAGKPGPTRAASIGVNGAIDALAAAGVGVYDGPTATAPIRTPKAASPLRLLRSQVENLAKDADGGGGIGADAIDDMLPMPPESVPFSFVLAGYVAAAKTPGAERSRTLMAGQDLEQPRSLLFPTIVLTLFVAEATATAPAATGQPTAVATAALDRPAGAPARPAALPIPRLAAGPCGDFSAFFTTTLQKIAAAIVGVLPDIPFLKAAISWALTKGLALGLGAAKDLIERIPFIQALRSAIGTLALAVTVVAALRQWTVSVATQPATAHYRVGAEISGVKAIGTVDDRGGDVFSPEVRECATLLGIDLPRGGAAGSAAAWQVVAGGRHASPAYNQDTKVDAGKRTTFSLVMASESEDVHRGRRIANDQVVLRVTVKRQDVDKVRAFIEGAITKQLPSGVYAALTGVFGDPLAKIAAMTDFTGQGRLVAEYHLADEPPASATPGPSPSGGRAVRVSFDRPETRTESGETVALAGRIVDLVACDGPYGTWKGTFRVGGIQSAFPVPWKEVPVSFSMGGGSGTRTVHIKPDEVVVLPPNITSDTEADVSVDGKTMTLTGRVDGDIGSVSMPIRPAPDASCP
ncbi:hypothetical protein HC031_21250 [Planosporangium thailandense]|uniref:Uncharacterized protein n=1 Tax=Planosporangium thailandense TaxID=765197 RepID=A0ABX0Y1J0_9ACTN|nr:hypothetical protein [Planosporangium thailandense]NJC72225.1 hypothetical protein [Planosporangium thailandense]